MKICLIPARSSSKRIPNKNILKFFGKPIIAYTIQKAIKSKLFDKIIVSTDSKKYAKIARKHGADVPFYRSKKLSNDFTVDIDVINDFIKHCLKNKIKIKTLCYLYPINPLLKIITLKKCYQKLKKKNCNKVITVKKFSCSIQKSFVKYNKDKFKFLNKNFYNKRTQDLNSFYHDAGQCYWYKIDKKKNYLKKTQYHTHGVEIKQLESYDIDTKEDLEILKKIYKYKLYY